ncbi:MAG: SpoIIIAH-like family protein, partial [Lachnospiraceae bacterium]|nr:SpoIIIAH-like family protein [Lachnospiraceae bacterium]
MIITALAAMIAVAGYLNYSGTRLDESLLSANSSAVEDTE